MKKRSIGFLSKENIDHDSEQFDYIKELHEYLWKFIRAEIPGANGSISQFVDFALAKAKNLQQENAADTKKVDCNYCGRLYPDTMCKLHPAPCQK